MASIPCLPCLFSSDRRLHWRCILYTLNLDEVSGMSVQRWVKHVSQPRSYLLRFGLLPLESHSLLRCWRLHSPWECFFFLRRVSEGYLFICILGIMFFLFWNLFLDFCFLVSSLFCFSAPCFFACLLLQDFCFPAFCFFAFPCFFASLLSLLLCFSAFLLLCCSASPLFCFSAFPVFFGFLSLSKT